MNYLLVITVSVLKRLLLHTSSHLLKLQRIQLATKITHPNKLLCLITVHNISSLDTWDVLLSDLKAPTPPVHILRTFTGISL